MTRSQALYTQVHAKIHALHPTLHLKRLAVWVWVMVGLIHSQAVHLSEIANHIPGDTNAAGRIMRVRRWLASRSIVSQTLYTPIITEVLEAWAGREVKILVDGCLIRHKVLQMLRAPVQTCREKTYSTHHIVFPFHRCAITLFCSVIDRIIMCY